MNCTFCGEEIARGTGSMYVKKDAKIFYFCSKKCEKNMLKLNRKPRNVTWTAEARVAKAQAKAAAEHKKKSKKAEKKAAKKAAQPVAEKAPVKSAKKTAKK